MDTIGSGHLISFLDGAGLAQRVTNTDVRKDSGHLVHSYLELATKVAELQFMNRDHVLLF